MGRKLGADHRMGALVFGHAGESWQAMLEKPLIVDPDHARGVFAESIAAIDASGSGAWDVGGAKQVAGRKDGLEGLK